MLLDLPSVEERARGGIRAGYGESWHGGTEEKAVSTFGATAKCTKAFINDNDP